MDLSGFFKQLQKLISKDTLVYIGVPSLEYAAIQYKGDLKRYFQIAHMWNFSLNTLNKVMLQNGFKHIESNAIIQSIYKYDGEKQDIQLLSEYESNKTFLSRGSLYDISKAVKLMDSTQNSSSDNKNIERDIKLVQKLKKYRNYFRASVIINSILVLILILFLFFWK